MEIGFGIFDHIWGDRYEESDTENHICFILAQATQGVCLCFFRPIPTVTATGKISETNFATYAVDVTMDVAIAPITYHYVGNYVNSHLTAILNGLVDGAIDVFQTIEYFPHIQ